MDGSSTYEDFLAGIRRAERERAGDVDDVIRRIGGDAASDRDGTLEEQVHDLKDLVAARCANAVADDAADEAIARADRRFADDVSNASVRTRIAALLTIMEPSLIGA